MNVDKTQAMIEYLLQCPIVQNNPTYFNFGKYDDNAKQIVSTTHNVENNKKFIDGSVQKICSVSIMDIRTVTDNALVKVAGYNNENVTDYVDSQGLIDWIVAQNDARNFPNFGSNCVVERIAPTTEAPVFVGVNNTTSPPTARYDITLNVTYVDNSKKTWNNIPSI